MKRTWIAMAFLTAVLTAGVLWSGFMTRTTELLCAKAEYVLQMTDSAPETVSEKLEELNTLWGKTEEKLDYIVMHHQIDEAKIALTECNQYYAQRAYPQARTALRLFADLLREMAAKEKLNIQNIF